MKGRTKYVGNKLTINSNTTGLGMVKFTQLVLVQKLLVEYKPSVGPASKSPAIVGQVMIKWEQVRGCIRGPIEDVLVYDCNLFVNIAMVTS